MSSDEVRKIIHVDMDAFYASVEQRNNPELKGKPVVVGGRPDSRGVVSTCSYEARVFGIHSAMPTSEAYRRCPHAVFIANADFAEYQKVSAQVRDIFHEVTDLVEPLSLDEAYLDVSSNKMEEASATRLARWIRRRILEVTSLTASAGVSYNKALAKIASDWEKPDGLTVITPDIAENFISGLPVSKFWGVGPVTAGRMKELGIRTGADLRSWPLWKLTDAFGKSGPWYYNLARGIDDRTVEPVRVRKSLGKERTFGEDIADIQRLREFLEGLCSSIWDELEERELRGKTVTVKVKYGDFQQVTRSRSFLTAVDKREKFTQTVLSLLKETEAGERPVRLLGASMSSFHDSEEDSEVRQLSLDFKTGSPGPPSGPMPQEQAEIRPSSVSIH